HVVLTGEDGPVGTLAAGYASFLKAPDHASSTEPGQRPHPLSRLPPAYSQTVIAEPRSQRRSLLLLGSGFPPPADPPTAPLAFATIAGEGPRCSHGRHLRGDQTKTTEGELRLPAPRQRHLGPTDPCSGQVQDPLRSREPDLGSSPPCRRHDEGDGQA